MNLKRILSGKISIYYTKTNKLNSCYIIKAWNNKLIYINISKFCIILDFRVDFIKDMSTGKIE